MEDEVSMNYDIDILFQLKNVELKIRCKMFSW